MTLWLILTILLLAAAVIVWAPFLRPSDPQSEAEASTNVYKDQLAEVERDKEAGLMDEAEADLARVEIERRVLASARSEETPPLAVAPDWQYRTVTGVAAIVVLGSVGLYAALGQPDVYVAQTQAQLNGPVQSAAAPAANAEAVQEKAAASNTQQNGGDVDALVKRLERRLEENPKDPDGWRVLGWSYYNTGRYDDSVKAYRKAVDLQKDNPTLRALLGEAMVKAAGGKVTDEALATFEQVLALNENDERARFFKGMAKSQRGDNAGALDEWISLYEVAPKEAAWSGDLRAHIEDVAKNAGIDVGDRLAKIAAATPAPHAERGPSKEDIENAKQMSANDRQAMVRGMVDRLSNRLEGAPQDENGWIMLMRSHLALNEPDKARAALERANKAFADAPETQQRIAQAAKAMGL